jgi:hypothetical protein
MRGFTKTASTILLVLLVILTICAAPALADWSVTVTWNHSPGPNLQNEKVFLDGSEKCNVLATDPATCNFVVPNLLDQAVSITSYNTQGTESTPYEVGNLLAVPTPASGGVITITIVP